MIVRGDIFRHILICNLAALWIFIIHSAGALITVIFFKIGFPDEKFIFIYNEIYLMIFLAILPFTFIFFHRYILMMTKKFYKQKKFEIYE